MRAIIAVYKREVAQYFRSPIAYAVAFALLLFIGVLFSSNLTQIVNYNTQISQQGGGGQPITASDLNLAPGLLTFLMFLVAPLLTMRLFSEERQTGTLDLLLSAPVGISTIVFGKYLGVLMFLLILTLHQQLFRLLVYVC